MAFVRDLDNIIPIMTSNTAPSGYIASASSEYSATYAAWKAFTNSDDDYWSTSTGNTAGTLSIQFPASKIVNVYNILPYSSLLTYAPNSWTFQGSNNGTDWTTLDTQSGVSTWSAATIKRFVFNNTTAYTYYRLNITANNGAALLCIQELELCATGQYASLIPIMTSNTAPYGTASASTEYSTNYAYRVLNNALVDYTDAWAPGENVTTGWLAYQFVVSKVVKAYSLLCQVGYPGNAPKSWTFEGWDGSNWVILDTQSNITDWSDRTAKTFLLSNTVAYIKYRINITQSNGTSWVTIGELRMFGYGGPVHRWQLTSDANDTYSPATPTTLDPAKKGTNITLSNGNLSVSNTTSHGCVLATVGRSSGKWYWEVKNTSGTGTSFTIGVANSSKDLNTYLNGTNSLQVDYDGSVYGTGQTWSGTWSTNYNVNGKIIGIALDLDDSGGKMAVYVDNVLQKTCTNVKAIVGSGTIYPAIGILNITADIRFAAGSMSYAPPTGYQTWDAGLNLTNNGTVTFGTDGASFNGSNSLTGIYSLPPQWSISGWASMSSFSASGGALQYADSSGYNYLGLTMASPSATLLINANSGGHSTSFDNPATTGNLYHYEVQWDEVNSRAYINGDLVATGSGSYGTGTSTFAIGKRGASNYEFWPNGSKALDTKIYDYNRTAADILATYSAGPNPASLIRLMQSIGGF